MKTYDQLIKDGLSLIGKEHEFRDWARTWIPESIQYEIGHEDESNTRFYLYSLADLAFRAREMAGSKWILAVQSVFDTVKASDAHARFWNEAEDWTAYDANCTPYHWLIAACAAIEMQRKDKHEIASMA